VPWLTGTFENAVGVKRTWDGGDTRPNSFFEFTVLRASLVTNDFRNLTTVLPRRNSLACPVENTLERPDELRRHRTLHPGNWDPITFGGKIRNTVLISCP